MSCRVLKHGTAPALPLLDWREFGESPAGGGTLPAGVITRAAAGERDAAAEREAYERGLREGEAQGARKALEQFQASVRAFAESAAAVAAYKPALRAEAERELVTLSLAVARKVLRRELTIDAHMVLAVVKACLEDLRNAEVYRLHLHPQDVPPVASLLQQQRRGQIELIPDPGVTRGGALFETSQGTLDARLETQLEEIERGLADAG